MPNDKPTPIVDPKLDAKTPKIESKTPVANNKESMRDSNTAKTLSEPVELGTPVQF